MSLAMQMCLLQYSTRFWTYRPPHGWVFDELTDEERKRLRERGVASIKRHGLLTTDGAIRLPAESPVSFGSELTEYLSHWFARCVLTNLSPSMLAYFQCIRVKSNQPNNVRAFSWDVRGHLMFDPTIMPTNKRIYDLAPFS